MTDTPTPVDPELFARTAPAFNCISHADGPHYLAGDGSCRWCGARERRTTVPPVPGVTEHDGYTVRAVIAGQPEAGQLPHWFAAAEGPEGWAVWTVLDDHGTVLWVMPAMHVMPAGTPLDRAAALAELAERARIAHVAPF